MFHKIARSGGTCRGPLQKSLWLVKDLCDLFSQKKSDFAASQVTALEEVAPACIFTMSPSIATCCHTGELPVPLSCPRTFAHLCSLLAICLPLSPLSRHWFTFRESAQMSLCQGSLPGCSLHPELLCSIWYRYQYLSVCWIIN